MRQIWVNIYVKQGVLYVASKVNYYVVSQNKSGGRANKQDISLTRLNGYKVTHKYSQLLKTSASKNLTMINTAQK